MYNLNVDAGTVPFYKLNTSDKISSAVYDLAHERGEVSLNFNALTSIKKYGRIIGYGSVFNEIDWINPASEIEKHFIPINGFDKKFYRKFWVFSIIEELSKWLIERLYNEFEEYWIMHSSGGDSRILSSLLYKLKTEGKIKGKFRFVSWYPEAEQSKKILKYIGWKDSDIWLVGSELKDNLNERDYWNSENYYSFQEAGILTNGEIHPFGALQSNFWRPYFNDVSKINVIMAMIADLVLGGRYWSTWQRKFYTSHLNSPYSSNPRINVFIAASSRYNGLGLLGYLNNFKELLIPTTSYPVLNLGFQIPFTFRFNDNIRKWIQEELCPGLSKFENVGQSWYLKSDIVKKSVKNDFVNSRFYTDLGAKKPQLFGDPYRFLSFASLYDNLIDNKIKVRYE